jgi:hypothetical protein
MISLPCMDLFDRLRCKTWIMICLPCMDQLVFLRLLQM